MTWLEVLLVVALLFIALDLDGDGPFHWFVCLMYISGMLY
jgi:hypothetical protein